MDSTFSVRPARPEDLATAFRLMFQRLGAGREARVANALYLVERGELEREGVYVACGRGGIRGALVCSALRGASGLVWPPQVRHGPERPRVEDALVRQANAWLRQRGARFAQALLPPEEAFLADPLLRNGFARVTRLHHMRHDLQGLGEASGCVATRKEPDLTYVAYPDSAADNFHQTLLRTYEATLDCPELNGVRTLDEIIDGHKGQGFHDPDRWWLAAESGRAVGVLLLADVPELGGWDLSYVGVVPEARGRGIGRQLTRKALLEAHAAAADRLGLAVDCRNLPALKLYQALDFLPMEEREVYLAFYGS